MGPDLRFAIDIGGPFTDLAIAFPDGASKALQERDDSGRSGRGGTGAIRRGAAADLGLAIEAVLNVFE